MRRRCPAVRRGRLPVRGGRFPVRLGRDSTLGVPALHRKPPAVPLPRPLALPSARPHRAAPRVFAAPWKVCGAPRPDPAGTGGFRCRAGARERPFDTGEALASAIRHCEPRRAWLTGRRASSTPLQSLDNRVVAHLATAARWPSAGHIKCAGRSRRSYRAGTGRFPVRPSPRPKPAPQTFTPARQTFLAASQTSCRMAHRACTNPPACSSLAKRRLR